MGGDGGFLFDRGAAGGRRFAALKGKTLSVDAMTTGLAFVLRELVAAGGVAESDVTFVRAGGTANRYRDLLAGKHDATLLRTPFELLAVERGLQGARHGRIARRVPGHRGIRAAQLGARPRGRAHRLPAGYRAGVDWIYDPANREIVEALLVANIRDMTPALAKRSYDLLLRRQGRARARCSRSTSRASAPCSRLRSKYGPPQKTLTDPAKYVDLSYLEKAAAKR